MTELPTSPIEPELLELGTSQIIAFRKFYKIALFNGMSDDWDGPLGQAATIALELSETHPILLRQIGCLNALLVLKESKALGIKTSETEQSIKESFGLA
ncbi:MAG: hypothetical protein U1C50_03550 [Patescibacteria group bacterium]|nr:hypothetical protein [Patescibacteria group bacterium]